MKSRLFFMIAAAWMAVAFVLGRASLFGIHFHGSPDNPAILALIFQFSLPVLFYGWIFPTVLGFWLLWTKR